MTAQNLASEAELELQHAEDDLDEIGNLEPRPEAEAPSLPQASQESEAAQEPTEAPYELETAPATKTAPRRYHDQPTRQGKLFDGLDCLPGQGDLF